LVVIHTWTFLLFLWQMSLPVWMIAKGFKPSAITALANAVRAE
jgi:hypothetical protein